MDTQPETALGQSLNPEVAVFLGGGGRQKRETQDTKEAGGRPAWLGWVELFNRGHYEIRMMEYSLQSLTWQTLNKREKEGS